MARTTKKAATKAKAAAKSPVGKTKAAAKSQAGKATPAGKSQAGKAKPAGKDKPAAKPAAKPKDLRNRKIAAPKLAYQPRDPRSYRPNIGLIACGGITSAHLRAY
jgi:hypothetical protein